MEKGSTVDKALERISDKPGARGVIWIEWRNLFYGGFS